MTLICSIIKIITIVLETMNNLQENIKKFGIDFELYRVYLQ